MYQENKTDLTSVNKDLEVRVHMIGTSFDHGYRVGSPYSMQISFQPVGELEFLRVNSINILSDEIEKTSVELKYYIKMQSNNSEQISLPYEVKEFSGKIFLTTDKGLVFNPVTDKKVVVVIDFVVDGDKSFRRKEKVVFIPLIKKGQWDCLAT